MIRCARFAAFGLTLAVLSACGVGVSQSRPPGAVTAYVVNAGSNTVTAFSTLTGRVIKTIKVGGMPLAIAITPDGRTAYVANFGSETVTPINTATQHAGQAIKVADGPVALAITPDGRTVYVAQRHLGRGDAGQHQHATRRPGHQARGERPRGRRDRDHPRRHDRLRRR